MTADSDPGLATDEHHALLAEIIAHHFDDWSAEGRIASIGLGGVKIHCTVNALHDRGSWWAASLFFEMFGGPLGDDPVFASISGYESDPHSAIVAGGCNWACSFGPLLRIAFGGEREGDVDEIAEFTAEIDGRTYRVLWNDIGRALTFDEDDVGDERVFRAREALAPAGLTTKVVQSGLLPALTAKSVTIVSSFVADAATGRTVEIKVDGIEVAGMDVLFDDAPAAPPGGIAMIRELAILVPRPVSSPRALTRRSVQRVIDEIAAWTEPDGPAGWQGWELHSGLLGEVLTIEQIERATTRRATELPNSYVHFVTEVAGSGAGPGYGLVVPLPPREGMIPLALAGCGVTWLLYVEGPHFGEVWVDAAGSDESFEKVADSMEDWYADWLHQSRRNSGPWLQWDNRCCASAGTLSQVLKSIEQESGQTSDLSARFGPASVSLSGSGAARWFDPIVRDAEPSNQPLDPCHGCVALWWRFGCRPEVFAPGPLLLQAHSHSNAFESPSTLSPVGESRRRNWFGRRRN